MSYSFAKTMAGQTLDIDLSKTRSRKDSLTTLCTDIFLIIIKMRQSQNLGQPAALRKLIIHYVDLFKKNCQILNLSKPAIEDAVYALIALLDETVLTVPGECHNFWLSNPLQLELFNTNIAGEGFFVKLDQLATEPEKMKEIIEIYYICLALGFEGKYRITGNYAQRDAIIDKYAAMLLKLGRYTSSGLSPHGRRADSGRRKRNMHRLLPIWFIAAFLGVLLIGWWVVVHFSVHRSLHHLLSTLM
ncbi:MAG: type IVB secretion system protein IcmH/DotU [Chitinivibrionales bacterium]|nr:type IVB secretion system protein IcmH/DotU [Chitinivibrionales bacterium]